jgi:hypothetical protein
MSVWIILVFLIVGAVTLFMVIENLRRKTYTTEGFGIFKDLSDDFTIAQRRTFHDQADKEILVNPGVNLQGVNDAFRQPDIYLPNSPDRDFSVYFREDSNRFNDDDFKLCKSAIHPKNLRRAPRATMGCGWWYVEDPNRTSTGALGLLRGPMKPTELTKLFPGGRWVWNLAEAAKLEDIKKCRRVKSCDVLNATGIHKECGFCYELGHGIPIETTGKPKYPNDENGSCPERVVINSEDCPRPQDLVNKAIAEVAETSDLEFDANGNVVSEGVPVQTVQIKAMCDPDRHGRLTGDCLISLAKSVGMSEQGSIIRLIRSRAAPNDLDQGAITFVRKYGNINVPEGVLGKGNVDKGAAADIYSRIVQGQMHTQNRVREAARYLCVGNENFDLCLNEDSETGPFAIDCMQREFRKAGCQMSGKAAPNDRNASKYSSGTWKSMKDSFAKLHADMKSGNQSVQDKAVQDCLGTSLLSQQPEMCDEPGIEYFVYTRADWNGQPENFVGRVISTEGFLRDKYGNSSWSPKTGLLQLMEKCKGRVYFRSRTVASVKSSEGVLLNGWSSKDAITVRVNNNVINRSLNRQVWSDNEFCEWYFTLMPRIRNVVEMIFNKKTENTMMNFECPYIKNNIKKFQLAQYSWKPVISLDFFTGKSTDTNGVASTTILGGSAHNFMSNIGSRQVLMMNGTYTTMQYTSVHSASVGSICFMFNLARLQGAPMLFAMNGSSDKTGQYMGIAAFLGNADYNVHTGISTGAGDAFTTDFKDRRINANTWIHYCMVMHGDRKGFDVYINGDKKSSSRGKVAMHDGFLTQCLIGDHGMKGGIAWFHLYDSYLTPEEVKRDMNFDNPNYIMEHPADPEESFEATTDYINYSGQTIDGKDFEVVKMKEKNSIEKNTILCANECGSNPKCVAYTYTPAVGHQCFLKETIALRKPIASPGIQAGIISNKNYILHPEGSPRHLLDVSGISKNAGAGIYAWSYWNGPNQKWKYDEKNRIISVNSNKCVDIHGGVRDKTGNLIQNDCNESDSQKWDFDSSTRLRPRHAPDKCLQMSANNYASRPNGARLYIDDCNSAGNNGRWNMRAGDIDPPR